MWRSTDGEARFLAYLGAMNEQTAPLASPDETAPASERLSRLRRILVGFDEKPASRDALAFGERSPSARGPT